MKQPKISTFLISIFISCHIYAGSQIRPLSLSWEDLTQEQYIDNLVRCKTKLDELKWTYNLWPKENKTPKPTFSEIVNPELIRYSILENLKMEAVLLDTFNFEVTPEMLQHDLDRMASNTKDPKRLKELFAVLNNDSMSIVQCVSKPYLVLNKLGSQYSFNNTVHTLSLIHISEPTRPY